MRCSPPSTRSRPHGLIPVAVGGQPWQLQSMFNAILLGEGGKDLYSKVWKDLDTDAVESDKFKHVAEVFAKLRDYPDPGSPNRDWNVATGMRDRRQGRHPDSWATGPRASSSMPTWSPTRISAAFSDRAIQLHDGRRHLRLPGPEGQDGCSMRQTLLATVIMSKEGQLAFNSKKGSVPVRLDVDTSKLDACAAEGPDSL